MTVFGEQLEAVNDLSDAPPAPASLSETALSFQSMQGDPPAGRPEKYPDIPPGPEHLSR